METYNISHERFQAWLRAQKEKGVTVTTGTYNFMKDWLERRVYAGSPPDDIEERRRAQKELHDSLNKLDARLEHIEENTTWLSKWLAGIFKFGGSQAEQKYPSKKK